MKTLTAVCDFDYCPVSFDFVTFLVRCMLERDERKCGALHVVIAPNEQPGSLGGFARNWGKHDEAATRWRFWHIVVASCPLAGATVTVAANRAQARQIAESADECWWPEGKAHFIAPLVDAARAGKAIPKLRATDAARRYVRAWLDSSRCSEPYVTLTVRQQDTDRDRNSNREAWDEMQGFLEGRACQTVWLDDAHVALPAGRGYAELDPDLRLALYEQASMNLIGANGPSILLHCSGAPYLNFGIALTDGWRKHYREHFHLDHEQLPWATPHQRMVFRPDSFEVMRDEFETWEKENRGWG